MGKDRVPRLVGLFLLFAFLLNFPIVGVFSKEGKLFGIPSLYFYLLIAWVGFIILLYLASFNDKKK